jgi:AraC family transcriptional regulator, regulatory protein of adaptative response / methylated-DNA-[protein]-cysteine methyltransferase
VSRAAVALDLSAQRRWRIVLERDRRYDGAFVYAVRSTGIYCRPSCPSRRPRRQQVAFFPVPEAAELAGFRACRRCRPGAAAAPDPRVPLVRTVCQLIDAQPDAPADLATLSARTGVTSHHLLRAFQRVLGISPRQYRDARRLERFKSELRVRRGVSRALYRAGYGSPSRVYERAHAQLGMTPAAYSRGAAGTQIAYAVVASPLGRLLVAATPRGICRVSLGDDAGRLEADLKAEFPAADIRRERAGGPLEPAIRAILRYLEGGVQPLDLPLDVRATAFQRRVWEALRRIPYGGTRTYTEMARAIGRPAAVRAVARACATNPAALVIPCHRVVRQDGALGGYRWGLERKQALLEKEAAAQ